MSYYVYSAMGACKSVEAPPCSMVGGRPQKFPFVISSGLKVHHALCFLWVPPHTRPLKISLTLNGLFCEIGRCALSGVNVIRGFSLVSMMAVMTVILFSSCIILACCWLIVLENTQVKDSVM